MLQELMQDMNKVVVQIILLDDKAKQMPTAYDEYDRHIDSWGIVGLEDYQ